MDVKQQADENEACRKNKMSTKVLSKQVVQGPMGAPGPDMQTSQRSTRHGCLNRHAGSFVQNRTKILYDRKQIGDKLSCCFRKKYPNDHLPMAENLRGVCVSDQIAKPRHTPLVNNLLTYYNCCLSILDHFFQSQKFCKGRFPKISNL